MQERVDGFLKKAQVPERRIPDPDTDFGMFQRMDVAFDGLHNYLDDLRRNQGRIGYTAQNMMSDLSKASIEASMRGDEYEVARLDDEMRRLMKGLNGVSFDGELAEVGNRFTRTVAQEYQEAVLFEQIWAVIEGREMSIPELVRWTAFDGNVQAFLYGYIDVVSELAKALTKKLSDPDLTTTKELALYERYLVIAESIALRLDEERHVPGYVINNGFGPFMAYTNKMRTVHGTIAAVRREYNQRLSMRRMIQEQLSKENI